MMGTIMQVVILLLVVAAVAWFFYRGGAKADAERSRRIADRPELSSEEFVAHFYGAGDVDPKRLLAALHDVARLLDLPPGKLRPSDRFDRELAPAKGWELDDGAALLGALLKQHRGSDTINAKSIETLNDFLRAASS
jgi:cbb3-type cytochrome oxidase subunit 3